jgi:hypothetical protein
MKTITIRLPDALHREVKTGLAKMQILGVFYSPVHAFVNVVLHGIDQGKEVITIKKGPRPSTMRKRKGRSKR